jgi:hypothetical protein
MTAINIVRQAGQIQILSDGAFYYGDGRLARVGRKVFPIPRLNAAVAVRGHGSFIFFVLGQIRRAAFKSFDQLIGELEFVARRASNHFQDLGVGHPENYVLKFDLYVAGWFEGRPESYLLANHEGHGDRYPPWQAVRLPDAAIAPLPTPEAFEAIRFKRPASVEEFSAEIDGLALLEAQRCTHFRMKSGAVAPVAAGLVQLTTLSSDRITSKVLRRWPDKIGHAIESPAFGRVLERSLAYS